MKQITQPDTQQSTDIQSAVGLYLFIYPLLIPNGLIKIIVIPYLKNQQSQTITNNRDTDPSTRGMANPSGLNRLRARVFKGKAISDCNSPAIASAYQHSDWKLWPQSDNPRRVRDALQYDAYDNLSSRNVLAGSLTGQNAYSYDKLDRLTQYTTPNLGTIALGYDELGNRITDSRDADPTTWQYDSRDRLTQRGKLNYSYDTNGSLTSISHTDNGLQRSFIYNLENRLIQVKDGQGQSISTYQYDPFGRRISKTVNNITTYYFYNAQGLIAELDNNGKITTQYGYRPDGTWGTNPLFIKQRGYTGYYQNDHLGTPQQIVSSSGQILWNASYSAFGQASVSTNVITNNLRLAGQYYDQETGLHYNYFRYYDPTIGRYISSDPIGLAGGINTYGYVYNNPLYWVDPFGLYNIVAGTGGSFHILTGLEVSGGILVNPGSGGQDTKVAGFISQGSGLGVNVSADVFAGIIFGNIDDAQGPSINMNIVVGPISYTGIFTYSAENGFRFSGFTVGLGPSITPVAGTLTASHTTVIHPLGFCK